MNYALVQIGGKQYKVYEGQQILVERLKTQEKESLKLDKVLFYRDEKNILVGQPYLDDVKIQARVLRQEKGKKIDVIKYKAKVHYRRKIGFRPKYTRLMIEKITASLKQT